TPLGHQVTFSDIKQLPTTTLQIFSHQPFHQLYIFYNHFLTPISQQLTHNKLLPLTHISPTPTPNKPSPSYHFDPSQQQILQLLLPQYPETFIFPPLLHTKPTQHPPTI
ncbi:F0F1 ATP synthase subunit gamma, partial [Bacillus pumilus]|uniref:F0F1 ATP synthase subunit gamma n=1 Tax=Bacillus pumilus TaxID=1408 RepID=UPI0016435051